MLLASVLLSQGELPEPAQQDLELSRELCRAMGHRFYYDYEYIETIDLNEDGIPDYILDGRGMKCSKETVTKQLFTHQSGTPFYVYVSTGPGQWQKALNAYVYEYLAKTRYGEMPVLDLWLRGEVGYQTNRVRYQWNGETLEIVEQEPGVEVPTQLWKQFE